MKAHTITWPTEVTRSGRPLEGSVPSRLRRALAVAPSLLLAATLMLALLVGSAWMADTAALAPYLHALLWAAGFVFLALAVEAEGAGNALMLAATGLALAVLAWLGSRIAGEFSLVASALVAIWIPLALLRR